MNDNFLINGQLSSGLNPFDRGLAFGDGVFRTFMVLHGKPQHWSYHEEILRHDANALGITIPPSKTLENDIEQLFPTEGAFIAKWIITRGYSERGYRIPKIIMPNRILLKSDYHPLALSVYEDGVTLEVSTIPVASHLPLGPIKHLNRLDNVMAKEGLSASMFDAIMLDDAGNVNECISHNIVARYGSTLHLPQQKKGGVSGASQQIILRHAKEIGYTCVPTTMSLATLFQADEIVITNAINGAIPVKQIQRKPWNSTKLAYDINTLFKKIK